MHLNIQSTKERESTLLARKTECYSLKVCSHFFLKVLCFIRGILSPHINPSLQLPWRYAILPVACAFRREWRRDWAVDLFSRTNSTGNTNMSMYGNFTKYINILYPRMLWDAWMNLQKLIFFTYCWVIRLLKHSVCFGYT